MELLADRDHGLGEVNDVKNFDIDIIKEEVSIQDQVFDKIEYEVDIAVEQYKLLDNFVNRLESIKAVRKADFDPLLANKISLEAFPNLNRYTEDYSATNVDETIKAARISQESIKERIVDTFNGFKTALKDLIETRIKKTHHWSLLVDKKQDQLEDVISGLKEAYSKCENFEVSEFNTKLLSVSKFYNGFNLDASTTKDNIVDVVIKYVLVDKLSALEATLVNNTDDMNLLVAESYNKYSNHAPVVFDKFVHFVKNEGKAIESDYTSSYPPISKDLKNLYNVATASDLEAIELIRNKVIDDHKTLGSNITVALDSNLQAVTSLYDVVSHVDSFRLKYMAKVEGMYKTFNTAYLDAAKIDFGDDIVEVLKVVKDDLFYTLSLIEIITCVGDSYCKLIDKIIPPVVDLTKAFK